jgi:aldose sugar dehydrogenase
MLKPLLSRPLARTALILLTFIATFLGGAAAVSGYQNRDKIAEWAFPRQDNSIKETLTASWSTIETGLLTLERADIPLSITTWSSSGGGIDAHGNTILYVSPSGHIATLDLDAGKVEYSPYRVPMDYDRVRKDIFSHHSNFNFGYYRVQDILIVPGRTTDSATLYVSHHVFDEATSDICGVVSQTDLELNGHSIKLKDGIWKEFYRIRECVNMEEFDWNYLGLEGGGKMLQLDEGHILLTVGDYGLPWELFVSDRVGKQYANDFSKILRINLASGDADVFANGVRNPQGLTMDADGQIWESEHGPEGGDEINLVVEGGDYGWPSVSLGMNYGNPREPIPTNPVQGRHEGFDPPVLAFLPSVGLSAVAAIPGDLKGFGLWSGDLLATSLVGRTLFHLRRDGDRLIYSEPINLGARLRDIAFLENGWIALLGGQEDQMIYLLRDVTDRERETSEPVVVSGYGAVIAKEASILEVLGEPQWGRSTFRDKCSRCHEVNGIPKVGPPLNGVVNRRIGSVEGFPYSDDLANAGGRWTPSKLNAFIRNPHEDFPGTTMPGDYGLTKSQRLEVIKFLSSTE